MPTAADLVLDGEQCIRWLRDCLQSGEFRGLPATLARWPAGESAAVAARVTGVTGVMRFFGLATELPM
jgi:hypothetical protein